ncbi:PcfJ domain-containing protein [Dokdonia sp.]|uniref:PcfJ domain-containing protein n=1 Tax=Dokdonia sp. TaxID=2024995 RepID=UPI003266DBCC
METLYTTHASEVKTTSKATSKYITLVEKIYNAENKPQEYKGTVESLLWSSFSKMSKTRTTWKRVTFKNLLIHMYTEGCYNVLKSHIYIQVLANVSTFGLKMVRPIERWQRPNFDPERQLESLINHCFAKYPTPSFLVSSFYEPSLRYQLWYVQLGSGKSVKTLKGLPDKFTSKMMHEFRNTPKGFSVRQAIIRAQALGFGASQQYAEELTLSRLSQVEGNALFWISVIQFFANQKQITHLILCNILEFLEARIQRDRLFTMKGRTLESLLSQAQEWYLEMQKMRNKANYLSWPPSGVTEMRLETIKDGSIVTYVAKELLTSDELYQEGCDMNHCVADYIDDCYAKETSIFSLRRQEGDTIKKLATIEIDPRTLDILQAEGNCNTPLSPEATKALNHWISILGIKEKGTCSNQVQNIPEDPPPPIKEFSDIHFGTRGWGIILYLIIRIIIALMH